VCVLCGRDFVSGVHWADRRPGEDGAADPGERHRERRRDRGRKAALANEVLRFYGLKVEDWGGSKYLVRDRKGRSELVDDLGSLWPAAGRLAGRAPDPLDPALQAALGGDG